MQEISAWRGASSIHGQSSVDGASVTSAESPVRRGPIYWLMFCGVLLIAAIILGTAITVRDFRGRALSSSERELENTVLLLARHFDQHLEDFSILQKDVVAQIRRTGVASTDAFKRRMSTFEMHEALRAKASGYSDVSGVNVFDSDGTLVNSSEKWPVPPISVADRTFFKAFKSGAAVSPFLFFFVRSRFSGDFATIISHSVIGPDGEFLGMVSRGITPAHFEEFFASVTLGEGSSIGLFHSDGTLLARYPHIDSLIGKNFASAPVQQQILSVSDHGTVSLTSPIDGQERLASARRLKHFPLAIVATTTVAAALADWREQTGFLIFVAGVSAVVIAIILFLVVRQLSQQHRASQQRLTIEKQRLDTAINNMSQGLVLFDSSDRLVVCNHRYIEMYGLSPDVIKPGCHLRTAMEHRKQTGSFCGDVDEYYSSVVQSFKSRITMVLDTGDGRSIQITNSPMANGGWVATHEDITERRQSEARIAHLAHYDALTGLANRVLFREQVEQELKRVVRGGQFAVLYIDIDEFKSINDTLGHQIGDELLKVVASRLKNCVRDSDFVARLGGDEFAIVQTAMKHPTDATELVTRIYDAIREPYQCLGHQLSTDASIGIAIGPGDGGDLDELLKNADLAMYRAKSEGRRTYRFFEPGMDAQAKARRLLESDLRRAIAEGGFELHYQPLVNLRDNTITGCEALLRWRHPERGMISPAEFIPVAEQTGLIAELGEWVLSTACAEAVTWPGHIKLAVNVSPVQFRTNTLALKVAAALAASGLASDRLELEITEAVLIDDDEVALGLLHQLRALGVRIALDDFGTGYSSLSYLQRFPFDKIKIDRCFVNTIADANGSSSIVQAVVSIATARNMTTTAEGVETEQQKELLCALGCTEMQGFLFSPAKPAFEIRQMFLSRKNVAA